MTEELIKQNALAYRNHTKEYGETIVEASRRQLAFEEGAHSRDDEVASLLSQLEDKDGYIAHLREELNKLRNPWISVEDRLPKVGEFVFVSLANGYVYRGVLYDDVGEIWYVDEYGIVDVTHWMQIPELKKGE